MPRNTTASTADSSFFLLELLYNNIAIWTLTVFV